MGSAIFISIKSRARIFLISDCAGRSCRKDAGRSPSGAVWSARIPLLLQRVDKLINRDRGHCNPVHGPPGAEFHRDPGNRLVVRRLHDIYEIIVSKYGILGRYLCAHLFNLLVHLLDPFRIFLDRLSSFIRQGLSALHNGKYSALIFCSYFNMLHKLILAYMGQF